MDELKLIDWLMGLLASVGLYFLYDIRATLKGQAEHVGHIDSRVSHIEGALETKGILKPAKK